MDKKNAELWMRLNRADFVCRRTGEVDFTGLAERCAAHFGEDEEGGPLDDETHWIWDLAVEVGSTGSR